MKTTTQPSTSLALYLLLHKEMTESTRKFHPGLDGIGFTEFTILFYLTHASSQKMRRIDLAQKMGLTASGITRILLPMEKLGLVKKESSKHDARVSYVAITASGKRNVSEKIGDAEALAQATFPPELQSHIDALIAHLQ